MYHKTCMEVCKVMLTVHVPLEIREEKDTLLRDDGVLNGCVKIHN